MLVLSRKDSDVVYMVVDGKILATVTLVDIRGDRARLGFEADRSVGFYRKEVWDRMQEEEANAVTTGIQLHGDSPRIVAGEAKEAERPAIESPS